jgi:flagellar assembly protein FliH
MAVLKQSTPNARVLTGGSFDLGDLRAGAEAALREAKAEAARIVAAARADAERMRAEARTQGHAEGRAAGFAEGEAAGLAAGEAAGREQALAAHDASFKALEEAYAAEFLRWNAQRDEAMRTAERELAGVAIAIAESIVREEIAREPKWVARAVEAAVALFARSTRVSIEIAPEDEALVAGAMPSLRAALPVGAEVELVARAGIARGGVVIRSSEGTVDARLETQFRRMRAGILGEAFAATPNDMAVGDASAATAPLTTAAAHTQADPSAQAVPSTQADPSTQAGDGTPSGGGA